MRCLVLLALVASAFAASSGLSNNWRDVRPSEQALSMKERRPGHEFIYNIDMQVASGLVVPGTEHAVTRMQASASLYMIKEEHAILTLKEVRMGAFQKEVDEPKQMLPLLNKITISEKQMEKLRMPVIVKMEGGLISSLHFDRDDQPWSENIKRSLLNMLQANMEKKNVVEETSASSEAEETVFRATEKTLEGECEVIYTVVPAPETSSRKSDSESEKLVTKSVNFDKCTSRAWMGGEVFRPSEWMETPVSVSETGVDSSSVLSLRIVGRASSFVVRSASLRSSYVYAPMKGENAFFNAIVLGELTLVDVKKSEEPRKPRVEGEPSKLVYSTEWEAAMEKLTGEGDESALEDTPFPAMPVREEVVVALVEELVESSAEERAPHELARLVKTLRIASKDELRKIHSKVCESGEKTEEKKELMYDALALAGTAKTIEHLAQKMRKEKPSEARKALIFKQLAASARPSEKTLELLSEMCKEQRGSPLARQSCLLSFGALLNRVCGEQRSVVAAPTCSRLVKDKYAVELKKLFADANSRYEKVLALKVVANAGLDVMVAPLEKIIRDREQEKSVRVAAIDALRKLRSSMPRKVQSVLLPLFKETREAPELRIAALHSLLQTQPSRALVDQLTAHLVREPSTQVASFLYSALHSLASSTLPAEERLAKDVAASLRLARHTPRKLSDSTLRHFTAYSEKLNAGGSLTFNYLLSNESVIPAQAAAKLESVFAGQWNKYLAEIGFSHSNMDIVLQRVLKKISENGLDKVVLRGKRAASSPLQQLRDLFSSMAVSFRRPAESDPHALLYVRVRDMDWALLPLQEDLIPEPVLKALVSGRVELAEIEKVLARGLSLSTSFSTFVYEKTRMVATSAGLPIHISTLLPTVARLSASIKAEVLPRNGDEITGLRLSIDAKPTLVSTHVTEMRVLSPIVENGVKLLHTAAVHLPVSAEISAEMEKNGEWTLKTELALPTEKDSRIARLSSRPATFSRVWPTKAARVYTECKEKTIYVSELEAASYPVHETLFEKATGLRFVLNGAINRHIAEKSFGRYPAPVLISHNSMELKLTRTPESPESYTFEMKMHSPKETSDETTEEYFNAFYDKDNERHFETESYEEYETEKKSEDEEKERKVALKKYVASYKGGKVQKQRITARVYSKGGRTEKKAMIELEGACDDTRRACSLSVKAERTPVMEEESSMWKLSASAALLYPESASSLEALLLQKHREVLIDASAKWGERLENEVRAKVQGEQDKNQKKWMRHAVQLKELNKEGANIKPSPLEQASRLAEAAMLNQYKLVAKYDIKSLFVRRVADQLLSLIKAQTPLMNSEVEFIRGEPRVVRAVLAIEPSTRRFANLTVETPETRVRLSDIRMPFPLRLVNIRRAESAPLSPLSLLSADRASCTVESAKVNTFDDVVYRTPLTTCYSVLAKDCSSDKPAFAVLAKKMAKNGEEKKVKIISSEAVIELEMEKDEIVVRIDGQRTENAEKLTKARVYVQSKDLVAVHLSEVSVLFDGYTVDMKLSDAYKNKQCGLCGHFDGERDSEFRRADDADVEEKDMEKFFRSYLVKGSECEVEEEKIAEKRNYKVLSKESSSSSEEESVFRPLKKTEKKSIKKSDDYESSEETNETEEKTRVIERNSRVCFSKKPVAECPRDTYSQEDKEQEKETEFVCLPRSNTHARRMMRQVREEGVVVFEKEMEEMETIFETITLPRLCIAY